MGLDLTVCPIEGYQIPGLWLGYERLSFSRDYYLFSQIKAIGYEFGPECVAVNPVYLPQGVRFDWYGDDGLGERTDDPYGLPLTYLRAASFSRLNTGICLPRNRAIMVYLSMLPPETPVVLWWH